MFFNPPPVDGPGAEGDVQLPPRLCRVHAAPAHQAEAAQQARRPASRGMEVGVRVCMCVCRATFLCEGLQICFISVAPDPNLTQLRGPFSVLDLPNVSKI